MVMQSIDLRTANIDTRSVGKGKRRCTTHHGQEWCERFHCMGPAILRLIHFGDRVPDLRSFPQVFRVLAPKG